MAQSLFLPSVGSTCLPTSHQPNQTSSLSVPDQVVSALAIWTLTATCKMADHEIRQLSLSEMITTLTANGGAHNMHSLFKATIPPNADMAVFLPAEQMSIIPETGFESPYLSFVAYLLSNNLLGINGCDRVFQGLRDQKGLKFFQRLISLKQPTIKAMAEKLLNSAIRAGEYTFVKLMLEETELVSNIKSWDPHNLLIDCAVKESNLKLVKFFLKHGADENAALRTAIRKADTEVVQFLLDHGAGYDDSTVRWMCLHAVTRGDVNFVRHFIGLGFCADYALEVAVRMHNVDIIKVLLDLGAAANEALESAITNADTEVIQLLLHHGADADVALVAAVRNGHTEVIDVLLDRGTDADIALKTAVKFADLASIRLILDRGADADIALEEAVRRRYTEIIELLLDYGADFDMAVKIAVGIPDIGIIRLLAVFKVNGTGQSHNVHQQKARFRAGLTGYGSNMIDLLRPHCYDIPAADTTGNSSTDCLRNGRTISAMQLAVHGSSTGLVRELLKIGVDVKNAPICKCFKKCDRTALHMAIRVGDLELTRSLLAAGADVHAQPLLAQTALQAAAAEGHYAMVSLLLTFGSNVDDLPNKFSGKTALQAAAWRGDERIVRLLLDSGADPNARPAESDGITAIQAAIMGTGDISLIKLLLDYGSDVNMRSTCRQPCTALPAAVRRALDRGGDLQIVELLLDNGANFNGLSVLGYEINALGIAVGVPDWFLSPPKVEQIATILPLVRLLLDKGADVNVACGRPRPTCLHLAVTARAQARFRRRVHLSAVYLSVIELLLSRGAGVIAQPTPGYGIALALQAAVEQNYGEGDLELVRLLLRYASNASSPFSHGLSGAILQRAVWRVYQPNNEEIVRLLISSGANVNTPGETSRGTALQVLISTNGPHELMKLLVDNGADVNAPPQGFMGRTALQAAAELGSIKAVQLLLSSGADINAPAAYSMGVTALQAASIGGYLGIVSLLLEHHADVNAPAAVEDGRTALEGAAEHGRLDTVQLLLNAGVKLSGPNDAQYLRALELAKKYGHFAAAGVLRGWVMGSSEHDMADDKN